MRSYRSMRVEMGRDQLFGFSAMALAFKLAPSIHMFLVIAHTRKAAACNNTVR